LLAHHTFTPDDRLQKSPMVHWNFAPPAMLQPEAMCVPRPTVRRVEM
jgi:hypothetical protein